MRVLHVVSGLFHGGGQRVVLDLVKALPDVRDIDLALCTLGTSAGSPLSACGDAVITYNGRYNNPLVLLRTARELRARIRASDCDIVHTHGLDADLVGALAVRGTRARQVCHLHIAPPVGRRESWKARLRRRLFRSLTARSGAWFIAVAESVRQQMAEYYRLPLERMVTIRNGVNVDEFATAERRGFVDEDTLVIGTAARLAPMKGLDHLIEAVRRLQASDIRVELRVAGDGKDRGRLDELAASLDVSAAVKFLGQVDDMPAFYRDLDVFVLPSLSEGLPLVVLEAMAARCPVVATRISGIPEVIRDGIDGLLVPPGDSEALGRTLTRLAGDPDLRESLAFAGYERVQNDFRMERVAEEVHGVYARVLNET